VTHKRHKPNVGDTRVAPNGYHYTYTQATGWELSSRLLMEGELGRKLKPNERVKFRDGDKTNITIDNLVVQTTKSVQDRIDYLNSQIRRLTEERDELLARSK
jgi:predicted DNA-binding antitoxin AbrB/MazE fold protein